MDDTTDLQRYIVHVDLDCFYCQVEQIRLGISFETPFVVEQWESIIAVNYPARGFGVQRMMTLKQAQKLCPNLQSAHPPTLSTGETDPSYHDEPTKTTHKISLQPYRAASARIHSILRREAGVDSVYERGGTDEAYADITFRVLNERNNLKGPIQQEISAFSAEWPKEYGDLLGDANKGDIDGWKIAAMVCLQMRMAVKRELGYECSAGIGSSKILAKLLSSKYKPNRQTTLLPSGHENFMQNIPILNVPGFGGIFGIKVTQFLRIETCGELWNISQDALLQKFDQPTIDYMLTSLKGEDCEDIVKERPQSKSILAAKNFSPTQGDGLRQWVHILVTELHARLKNFLSHDSQVDVDDGNNLVTQTITLPKFIALELKWIDAENETESAYELAKRSQKVLSRSIPFHVPSNVLLDSSTDGVKVSHMKLLQNVLSYFDLFIRSTRQRFYVSMSLSLHTMEELELPNEIDEDED